MCDNPFDKPRTEYEKAYSDYLEASQRFDYFIAGVSIAMVGYLGSRYSASTIGWNASTTELVALVLLLASAFSGLKRVQTIVFVLKLTQQHIREVDSAAANTQAAVERHTGFDYAVGQALSAQDFATRGQTHRRDAEFYEREQQRLSTFSSRWSRCRDTCLILGLGLVIFAKLLAAYK